DHAVLPDRRDLRITAEGKRLGLAHAGGEALQRVLESHQHGAAVGPRQTGGRCGDVRWGDALKRDDVLTGDGLSGAVDFAAVTVISGRRCAGGERGADDKKREKK